MKRHIRLVVLLGLVSALAVPAWASNSVTDSNAYRTIVYYYDDSGRLIAKHQSNAYGPHFKRDSSTDYYYSSASSTVYYQAVTTSSFSTKVEQYDSRGNPTAYTETRNYGPLYSRSVSAVVTADTTTHQYRSVVETSLLDRRLLSYDANGHLASAQIARSYGSNFQRNTVVTYTNDLNTGLPQYSQEANQLEQRQTWYDVNGLPTAGLVARNYGPPGLRQGTISYVANDNTGFIASAHETNSLQTVDTWYDSQGLPSSSAIARLTGPTGQRNSSIIYITNANTGLYESSTETSSMETRVASYNAYGNPASMIVARRYGLSGARSATVSIITNNNTGLFVQTTESSSAETRTATYDADGNPSVMSCSRNYGPADQRQATITYSYDTGTNQVRTSVESTTYGTKITNYDSNGYAASGTLHINAGPAGQQDNQIYYSCNAVNATLYIQEVWNDSSLYLISYNSDGVPTTRYNYEMVNGAWTYQSSVPLAETDVISLPSVVRAS